jgi:uncharacterized protein
MVQQMRPVSAGERVIAIDTLRGVALGGVLLVNLLTSFRAPLSGHILGIGEPPVWAAALLLSLAEFKAFTLFSLLFGVGIAIQAERAERKGVAFFLRRFGALLTFGVLHLLFVWNGDILTLYAICGLALLPFLTLPASTMAVCGLILIGSPYFVTLPVHIPDTATLRELTAGALDAYRTGGWKDLFAFRCRETELLVVPLLLLSLPRTLGLMLWGVAAWRSGFLEGDRRLWWLIMGVGAPIGLAGSLAGNGEIATVPLALAYGAAVLLWNLHAPWIAAAGQMALTNYLLQSIIFGFVFYSYGLALFGTWGSGLTLFTGAVFYTIQSAASRWWLGRFYFGPFEWLWRSISYMQWQPFTREQARTFPRETLFVLLPAAFLFVPLVHLGGPLLLARLGPNWGWRDGFPRLFHLGGAFGMIAGILLLAWILVTMLRSVPTLPPRVRFGLRPAQLVEAGPYSYMRHPMYVAEGCLWIGTAVLYGSPVVAGAFACLAGIACTWLIRREEKALLEQFGARYRSYCARVPSWPLFTQHNRRF